MNKTWLGVGGAAVLAVAAWAGSGVYIGMRAEQELKALASATGPASAWRVSRVDHQRGMFQSSGKLLATYSPGCTADAGDGFAVEVGYSMSHLPLPTGAARFQWQLTPQGEAAEAFETLFRSASALTGEGTVGVGGAVRSSMALPQVFLRRSGEVLEVTPSQGQLTINGQALALQWQVDRVVARGKGQAFNMQGLNIDLDIDNRSKGTGSGSIKIANASASLGSMEGLELKMEAREQGDRLNSSFTPSLRKIEGGGQVLTDLRMEWALNGLHTASVESLIKLFEDSCGMDALTAKESQTAADALQTLLAKGFSFGMPTLTGKAAQGSVEGSFVVELTEAKGGVLSLADQLRSNGKITITGPVITPEQREMAVSTGFAVAQGDALSASYEYAKGLFKVNSRTMDATFFEDMLAKADEGVQTALASLREQSSVAAAPTRPEAPAAQAPEAAAAPAPESAPQAPAPAEASAAAPAAPTGDCNAIGVCVQQTLAAASQGDLDGVRRVATQIDALPKPDLGNKAVARKLNAAALEALKADDVAGAISQLRQARQENPQDVEIAANLGFALVKANDPNAAQAVLKEAVLLNPRRTSTWTPLAEALALSGQMDQAKAALWVAFQWSSNRDKSLAFYLDRSTKETRPALTQLYAHMANVAEAAIAQDGAVANR